MHILDTDTLTHLHAGHPRVIEHLRRLDDPAIGTTIITKIEILKGRFDFLLKASNSSQLLKAQRWLHVSEELLAQILILPIDERVITHVDRLKTVKGIKKIGRADLLIASIALAHKATLVTRNVRHFKQIPGILLTNWVD